VKLHMKFILTIALLAVGITIGGTGLTEQANASNVYSGTPKAIRGWWRTKMHKVSYRWHGKKKYTWDYQTMHILKTKIRGAYGTQADSYGINDMVHLTTTTEGIKVYTLGGNEWIADEIVFSNYVRSGNKLVTYSGTKSGNVKDLTTWYKFSGKASKKTYYPYK